jgi:hypothetical protein
MTPSDGTCTNQLPWSHDDDVLKIDLMEELHTESIDGGHEANYGARSRAWERAYSNTIYQKEGTIYLFISSCLSSAL